MKYFINIYRDGKPGTPDFKSETLAIPSTREEAIMEAVESIEWGNAYVITLTDEGPLDLEDDIREEVYGRMSDIERKHDAMAQAADDAHKEA